VHRNGATDSKKEGFMRAVILRKFAVAALAVVAVSVMSAPLASANSKTFDLAATNLTGVTNVGTVTIKDVTGGVQVTITMATGYSVKLEGGDVAFNLSGGPPLALSDAGSISITGSTKSGSFTHLKAPANVSMFGTFSFDFTNIKGENHGVVSSDSITFTITAAGLTANDFSGLALHFCTASGTNCGPRSGFADGTPQTTTPEPGSMALLGTGLLGLAGVVRRRAKQ
jgi:PEP-CTERM motif